MLLYFIPIIGSVNIGSLIIKSYAINSYSYLGVARLFSNLYSACLLNLFFAHLHSVIILSTIFLIPRK